MQLHNDHIRTTSGERPYFSMSTFSDLNQYFVNAEKDAKRDTYDIIWINDGDGEVLDNHSRSFIKRNTVCCTSSGQVKRITTDQSVTGLIISFNYDFVRQGSDKDTLASSRMLLDFMNCSVVELGEDVATEFGLLVKRMQSELSNSQPMKHEVLRFYLQIVLIHICRIVQAPEDEMSGLNRTVKRFLLEVETNFLKRMSVTEYASLLSVSANYLNQIVKQQTGDTAGYYIRRRIIAEAKRKATYSDQSMKEIAFSLGFDSEAHFSTFFKNYSGTSFTEFKRKSEPMKNTVLPVFNVMRSERKAEYAIMSI